MTEEEAEQTLNGEKGDDAQFALLKSVITLQIDRAFSSYHVAVTPNMHKREGLGGTFVNYNPRGQSNGGRPTR